MLYAVFQQSGGPYALGGVAHNAQLLESQEQWDGRGFLMNTEGAVQATLAILVADFALYPERNRKASVKAECQRRIFNFLPAWRQTNCLALSVHLQSVKLNDATAKIDWQAAKLANANARIDWLVTRLAWVEAGSIPANNPGSIPAADSSTCPAATYVAGHIAQWGTLSALNDRAIALRTHSDALEANANLTPNWPE